MTSISHVVLGIAILHLITPLLALENSRHDARKKVLDWLAENPEFKLNDKLAMRDGSIVVEETIEADEVLMVIPESKILTVDDEEDEDPSLCLLFEYLDYEIGLGEESKFAPYIFQIQQEQASDLLLPSLWSSTAQRLIMVVSITSPNFDIVSLIDDYSECIYYAKEDEDIVDEDVAQEDIADRDITAPVAEKHQVKHPDDSKTENKALEISPEDKVDRLILALAIKHQIDQTYFVPLYDQLPHHHLTYNVKHSVRDDDAIEVVAIETIPVGDEVVRQTKSCLQNCSPLETTVAIDTLKKYGEVQPYPHLWKLGNDLSFIYNGNSPEPIEDTMRGKGKSVKWINPPTRESQLEIMDEELTRQRKAYRKEVLLSTDSVDPKEWEQIDRYCRSLMGALKDAIKEGYEYLDTLETLQGNGDSQSDDDSEDESQEPSDHITERDNSVDGSCIADDVANEQYQEAEGVIPGSSMERVQEEMLAMKDALHHDYFGYLQGEANDPWLVKGCGTSERCTMVHIAKSRGCNSYDFNARRNQTEWATMRSAYIATVGPRRASIKLSYGSGFRIPIKIAHSPGRGRGVFATTDIPKGTLVWTSDFTATFEEGFQFRKFLSVLPDDMVCDLLFWCYTMKDEGEHVIACDLDESSLFNHADHRFEYNIGEIPVTNEGREEQKRKTRDIDSAFSLRDIDAGEELITSYDEFHSFGFDEMGLA
ncbi:unnamed protein product [Cylindrotheca closterium]|uniref:SET domain-containing protein n=1 Tax=Cylindrotheca closterium TaxID=2856 RepID=A0AAD2CSM7_9STRA|nr:unnamed protein product [Cylindrotheca closterium]